MFQSIYQKAPNGAVMGDKHLLDLGIGGAISRP